MKILVTGANGFIGKSLCSELSRLGYIARAALRTENVPIKNVEVAIVGDIDSATDWSNALHDVDVVVHLAARVHVLKEQSSDTLAEFRKVNVDGMLNLAKQASQAGVKRFVFISSIGVNCTQSILPFTEENDVNPHNAYARSKFEAEDGLKELG